MRSFRVDVLFQHPLLCAPCPTRPGAVDLDNYTAVKLSHLCDQLHLLVARLRLKQGPISGLEIAIHFSSPTVKESSSLLSMALPAAVQILLNPFRRLCKISRSEVSSIAVGDSQNGKANILLPGWMAPETRHYYDELLGRWSQELSGPLPSTGFIGVLEGYWRLANLIFNIDHNCGAEPIFNELPGLLVAAKRARETGDLENLGRVWERVTALWFTSVREQRAAQSKITLSILVPSE
jgi:hypothetical protein